jgi:hypothetical protein
LGVGQRTGFGSVGESEAWVVTALGMSMRENSRIICTSKRRHSCLQVWI